MNGKNRDENSQNRRWAFLPVDDVSSPASPLFGLVVNKSSSLLCSNDKVELSSAEKMFSLSEIGIFQPNLYKFTRISIQVEDAYLFPSRYD